MSDLDCNGRQSVYTSQQRSSYLAHVNQTRQRNFFSLKKRSSPKFDGRRQRRGEEEEEERREAKDYKTESKMKEYKAAKAKKGKEDQQRRSLEP